MATVSEADDNLLLLDSCQDFQRQAVLLANSARRQLDILSRDLDFIVYDRPELVDAVSAMVRSHRLAKVRLLVKNTQPLIERSHGLVRLAQRLPSKVELRKLVVEPENTDAGFLLCDRSQLLYKNDEGEYRGFVNQKGAAEVRALRETFSRVWEYARPEPKLKLLYL